MNAQKVRMINLPIKDDLLWIYSCSLLVAILMAAVSIVGLQYRPLIYPTDELIRTFVPNDAVNLFVGLPLLLGSIWLAWRGRLIGLLCWPGALLFVLYNSIAYVFAVPLSWAFPLHLVLMMLCTYTLIALVASIDGTLVQQRLTGKVPEKLAGGVLVGLGSLTLMRVIGVMVSALTRGAPLAETELAVSIADVLITPAWVIGGVLLWRHEAFGYVAGSGLFLQGSMLFIALIAYLLLQPLLTAVPLALADLIVIFVMGLVCFIPFGMIVRSVTAKRHTGTGSSSWNGEHL